MGKCINCGKKFLEILMEDVHCAVAYI